MATVTAYTKEHMDAIVADVVVDGSVVGDNLILEQHDGSTINAGNVRGATGATGATGPAGADGPAQLVMPPHELSNAPGSAHSTDFTLDIFRNNVPVVAGRTYGINVEFELAVANFGGTPTPRWDFVLYKTGVAYKRFYTWEDDSVGVSSFMVTAQVWWFPSVTGATEDFTIRCDMIATGAVMEVRDTTRSMYIMDYGVVT